MLLAILPTQVYVLIVDIQLSLPWHEYSFAKIHGPDWNTIIKVATHGQIFFDRWIPIGGALSLFVFFGFGKDATSMYRSIFVKLGIEHWFPSKSHSVIFSGKSMSSSGSKLYLFSIRAKRVFTWKQYTTSRSARVLPVRIHLRSNLNAASLRQDPYLPILPLPLLPIWRKDPASTPQKGTWPIKL